MLLAKEKVVIIYKEKVNYPFSKARVYFNAISGLVIFLISAYLLIVYSTLVLLTFYLIFSAIVSFGSFKLKLHLLYKMQKAELETFEEETGKSQKWLIILVAIALGIVLLLPVVSTLFLDPTIWFIIFSGFVTGMSFSEVLLYLQVRSA
ncbi:hypothetical protein DRO69_04030 [Candidatus Bathyarchaeota archaeon]|nr:MAG: hypothetical protein DRO69_04030 [Candidatus Bathyarchaeota archaeon]